MARPTRSSPNTAAIHGLIAAIYLRVSTDEQASSGFGLDVQRTQTTGMAMVNRYQVRAVHEDAGLNGTLGPRQRPALTRLLADVKASKAQVVIIVALDRLGRSTRIIPDVDRPSPTAAHSVSPAARAWIYPRRRDSSC